jgi:hypothetical protein
MPKQNAKCKKCALTMATDAAMQRSCWVGRTCKNRRYDYLKRGKPLASAEVVPMASAAYAVVRLWQTPQIGRHAIGLELWRGSAKIAASEVVHVVGVHKRDVEAWTAAVLEQFREIEPGVEIRQTATHEPGHCPIGQCPLKLPEYQDGH